MSIVIPEYPDYTGFDCESYMSECQHITKNGYHVLMMGLIPDSETASPNTIVVFGYREMPKYVRCECVGTFHDYFVAWDYNLTYKTWGQGHYDFVSFESAMEYFTQYFNKGAVITE